MSNYGNVCTFVPVVLFGCQWTQNPHLLVDFQLGPSSVEEQVRELDLGRKSSSCTARSPKVIGSVAECHFAEVDLLVG